MRNIQPTTRLPTSALTWDAYEAHWCSCSSPAPPRRAQPLSSRTSVSAARPLAYECVCYVCYNAPASMLSLTGEHSGSERAEGTLLLFLGIAHSPRGVVACNSYSWQAGRALPAIIVTSSSLYGTCSSRHLCQYSPSPVFTRDHFLTTIRALFHLGFIHRHQRGMASAHDYLRLCMGLHAHICYLQCILLAAVFVHMRL